ncbi:MAG: hypothetical protein QM608_17475 [Caulobacter sp.]
MTDTPLSALKPIVLTTDAGVAFLQRHPATREVATEASETGLVRASLHFVDAIEPPPEEQWAMPNADVPEDRPHDLSFGNTGHAPPYGFWITHPDVLAWATDFVEDERADWEVLVWLKEA